ncbi:uncharacterized protein LOC111046831 [Nilaparvata lugens]|uniref:uncharacterized protein LOC111046831 n=1 Tax=Nilaparvata lugens TaxID=108931 RepID=UPI00193D88A3|nr:uncharacterized protein LOC111046831 [Nilaparvata lugens]XP_039289970.1 uncharacterized protein LOC111046831 [Nilaparvata lugens]
MPKACCIREIEKDFGYRSGVLVGNWIDKQDNFKNQKIKASPTPLSVYKEDFKMNFRMPDRLQMYKNLKHNWGDPRLRLCVPDEADDDKENYCDGFVTLNDLVYHHHIKDTVNAEYGNLTRTGLKDEKKKEWTDQKRLDTYETSYRVQYHDYPRECLQIEHVREHRCKRQRHNHKRNRMCCFMPHAPKNILPSL